MSSQANLGFDYCKIICTHRYFKGVDLDKALEEFKKINGYGFNDFSALILFGPLGAVVSNGYGQLEAFEKIIAATSDSIIKRVVSDWNVVAGVVTAKDVAFSTQRNRVAVKGSFDIAYDGSVPYPTGGSSSGHK